MLNCIPAMPKKAAGNSGLFEFDKNFLNIFLIFFMNIPNVDCVYALWKMFDN